jgi:hypothetical protein
MVLVPVSIVSVTVPAVSVPEVVNVLLVVLSAALSPPHAVEMIARDRTRLVGSVRETMRDRLPVNRGLLLIPESRA